VIERIARDTAIACVVMAVLFAGWKRDIAGPVGVLGGGLLIGLSFWAIRGTVDALVGLHRGSGEAENVRTPSGFALVKFFTRHGILALAAYGMMVRLHVDPLGLLAGVSSLGIAVAVEAFRDLRWRRFL
jgi:hypothetical protein